jgi:DNA polymerase I-like protein with 3'-5' exonuclease and polymerase domains/uracil-DNA glycosylase
MNRIYPTGPSTAKVMLVGEFPGEGDLLKGTPMSSSAGFELTKMLKEANLFRESCFITSVVRSRAPGGTIGGLVALKKSHVKADYKLFEGRMVHPLVIEGIEELRQEIELVKPNVIVPMGNLALLALTGQWGANAWRSSLMDCTLVPGFKVIPTLSPNVVFGQWKWRALIVHDLKRVQRDMQFRNINRPEYNFLLRPDFTTAVSVLTQLAEQCEASPGTMKLGADIETRAGHIACIAFAWTELDAICIPLMCLHNREGYWTLEEEAVLCHLIYRIGQAAILVGQNWNYDAQYIFNSWHWLPKFTVEDTMLKQHSVFSNMEKNLSFLSSMYCDDHLHWKDDRTLWQEGEDGEGEDKYWAYNCTDSCRTLKINTVLTGVVSAFKLDHIAKFQQELAAPVLKTILRGVKLDMEVRAQFAMEIMQNVADREAWLKDVIGYELNIKSPKQMAEFFYTDMGQAPYVSKEGGITTNDEALHKIAAREPILRPITRKVAELRSLGVFNSNFIQARPSPDGRIRTNFKIAGTKTYRFASTKDAYDNGCNFQNVPNGGETEDEGLELPNVRRIFIPDEGNTFWDIDLDSADLRIVAAESDCKWLKAQLAAGKKPYVEVAKEYYNDQSITKSHKSYPVFKALCHGTHYLGTPQGMAGKIGLLVHEVERIQKWYFGLCPEIREWHEEIKKQVSGRRYITNIFGYRYNFFDKIEGNIFNEAVAWIPQSTVGQIINRAYVNIHNNLPEAEVLLQVHDSLAGQYPSHLGWVKDRIMEEARIILPYPEPLIVPVGIKTSAKSWGDCK